MHLKPKEQWRAGMTLDRLRADMGTAVQLPGVSNIWTMPIINRIDMLTTGIRSEVGVKIFGTDLATLESLARRAADVVRAVPGASNVYPEQVTSGQYLEHQDRSRRGGAIRTRVSAMCSRSLRTPSGKRTWRRRSKGASGFRCASGMRRRFAAIPQALGRVLVAAPGGAQIALSQLATIEHARGPAMISSENGLLLATVLLNVQGRDVGGFVDGGASDARARARRCRRATTSGGAADGRTRNTRGSGCRSWCRSSCW